MASGAPGSTPSPYRPIKLRIAPEPKFLDRRQQNTDDLPPAHLLNPTPRAPSHRLPPMAPVANHIATVLTTPHVSLEDLAKIEVGDTAVYGSGTRRRVLKITEEGITVETTKRLSAGKELDGKFHPEPGVVYSSDDYLHVESGDIFYQNGESADSNGIEFIVVNVEISGDRVYGVIFSYQQFFPEGFAPDVDKIIYIEKSK